MKIQAEHLRCKGAQSVLLVVTLAIIVVLSGCNIVGILGTPGAFERKVPPEYDLIGQQDRKVMVWLEFPHSSGVDHDVREKMTNAFKLQLNEYAKILPENIIWHDPETEDGYSESPIRIAQEKGAGYLLLVQVDDYELFPLNVRDYYSGRMMSHAALIDTDLGETVWPQDKAAKVVEVDVDLETEGREPALKRLISGTAHCTLRYLYPCQKLGFKIADERLSIQEAYEMETY